MFDFFSVLIVFTIIFCAILQTMFGTFGTVLMNKDIESGSNINNNNNNTSSASQIEQFFSKYIVGSHSFVAALLDDSFWFAFVYITFELCITVP